MSDDSKIIKIPYRPTSVFNVPLINSFISETPEDVIDYILDENNYIYKNKKILNKNLKCSFYYTNINNNECYVSCEKCNSYYKKEYIIVCVAYFCYKCATKFTKENNKIIIFKNCDLDI
jgi:hypothetical protein